MTRLPDALALFARTGDGVWAVDAQHRIVLWNQAAEELLGYRADQVLGQPCHQILRGKDLDGRPCCATRCSVSTRISRQEVVEAFDLGVRTAAGRWRAVNVSIVAVPQETTGSHVLVHLFRPLDRVVGRPPGLRILLLGPVAVMRPDGTEVDGPLWRRAKVRALLSYLALRPGQPVQREELLRRLWPELERDEALHNLNTTVYGLRRSLEPGLARGADSCFVRYEADCYFLSDEPSCWLDVDAFEDGITRARREPESGRAQALYREALALYRDDFVADLDADLVGGWPERERLRQRYLNAMEELGVLCEEEGHGGEARNLYLQVLAEDSCREVVARRLMQLEMGRGERAAAAACYRRLEEALRLELGIAPEEETRSLYQLALGGG